MSSPSPDLHNFLRSRRSVRAFSEMEVSSEVLGRILESALWAPNSHNRQPWKFVHLASSESRQKLVDALNPHFAQALQAEGLDSAQAQAQALAKNRKILNAPQAVLLCLDNQRWDHYEDPIRDQGEKLINQQSVALAGGQMLLAAHAEGLGAVWVCAPLFKPKEVSAALDLPDGLEAQALILIGYPKEDPKPKFRRELSQVLLTR